jgi:acetate kinase
VALLTADGLPRRVLVVNAGSSSLKLSVLDERDSVVSSEVLETPQGQVDGSALRDVIERNGPIGAVGHRIVHGGTEFTAPVLIDGEVVRRLEALSDLAPLHQPRSLAGLDAVSRILPETPAVACFDTAFHATIPATAATYALPAEWRQRWQLRRFGFHGLSHAYASRRASELMRASAGVGIGAGPGTVMGGVPVIGGGPVAGGLPAAAGGPVPPAAGGGPAGGEPAVPLRLVTCHLGAGASLAAVRGGASVDTTMGFTPNEGLVMATRSGSVDPGLLLWLQEHAGMAISEVSAGLEQRSGLAGLAGTADMREVLATERAGEPNAVLAMGVYLHRLRAGIAAMVAALGGLDALVYTGGIGERSAPVRWRAAEGLGFLGVELDQSANEAAKGDQELSPPGAPVRAFVIEAREDLEIARGVRQVLPDLVA